MDVNWNQLILSDFQLMSRCKQIMCAVWAIFSSGNWHRWPSKCVHSVDVSSRNSLKYIHTHFRILIVQLNTTLADSSESNWPLPAPRRSCYKWCALRRRRRFSATHIQSIVSRVSFPHISRRPHTARLVRRIQSHFTIRHCHWQRHWHERTA